MQSLQTTATVTSDGKLIAQVPLSILPGRHRIVLVIADASTKREPQPQAQMRALKVFKWNAWPADSTFRREEIYVDEGR